MKTRTDANTDAATIAQQPKLPCPPSRAQQQKLPCKQQSFVSPPHAFASTVMAVVGVGILFTRKGTKTHRVAGRVWTGIAVITGLNTFRLRDAGGHLTWFHGLSAISLSAAAAGVCCARTKQITRHKKLMAMAYMTGALAGAWAFATPGKKELMTGFARPT